MQASMTLMQKHDWIKVNLLMQSAPFEHVSFQLQHVNLWETGSGQAA